MSSFEKGCLFVIKLDQNNVSYKIQIFMLKLNSNSNLMFSFSVFKDLKCPASTLIEMY